MTTAVTQAARIERSHFLTTNADNRSSIPRAVYFFQNYESLERNLRAEQYWARRACAFIFPDRRLTWPVKNSVLTRNFGVCILFHSYRLRGRT